ncbi:MAG: hypothetical protein RJA99_3195 [Pseudomonadota bacterium]|jgi:hypothetical protein
MLTKTGEVFFRDPDGVLWLAESFTDEAGHVTTQQTEVSQDSGSEQAVQPTLLPD